MRILAADSASATVILERRELLAVNNALNEVCNALDISGFETRMGVSRAEALALLTEIGGLIRREEGPAES